MQGFYNITTAVKNQLLQDDFCNTVTIGDIFNVDLKKQTIFPLSHIIVNSADLENNVWRFNMSVISMDIVDKSKELETDVFIGNDNEHDVLNTQLAVLNRLLEVLRRGSLSREYYQLDGNPSLEPFTERFENYLAGWTATFDVLIPNTMTACDGITTTVACANGTVTITDDAGNTLYNLSVVSGGSDTQIISDVTVSNSDATYSVSVNAEGSLILPDITVTDSDGSSSSFPSAKNVTCTPSPNTALEVNGTSEGSVVAGSTVDIQLSDSGGTVTPTSVTQVGNDLQIVLPDAPPSTPQYIVEGYFPNAAYSLRKVSENATNAIRVRRSSDNAEQNIGFVGDDLDTASLLSFVGAGDGFVVRIYNQGGIGSPFNSVPYLDAIMSTSSIQPKIVSSGSLVTLNGSPSMIFDGIDDRINFGVYEGSTGTIWDLYSTFRVNTNEQFVLYVSSDNNAPQGGFIIVGQDGSATSPAITFTSLYKNGSLWSPTTRNQVHDELATNQMVLLASLRATQTGWGFNGYEVPTWNFVGYWCETIFFERDTSAIRTDLETNINNYFNAYP